jgi:hypothetical protein
MKQKLKLIKQALFCLAIGALFFVSCKEGDDVVKTYSVKIQLNYPEAYNAAAGVRVKLINTLNNSVADTVTDHSGIAYFEVLAGAYEATATETRSEGNDFIILNGIKSNIVVADTWNAGNVVELTLSESKTSRLVIKELYNGGCQKDDGSGSFQRDPYVILYNNSTQPVSLENLCLAMALPYNSQASSNADYVGGVLFYEAEGWIPAGTGIWTFKQNVTLDPGKQIVIALQNALDNTGTYSKSINFSNPEYYCTYDIEVYANTTYYPSPSDVIPTDHYLKAYHYGTGNAWPLSTTSPAFFIFQTEGTTPAAFAADAGRTNLYNNSSTQVRKKVPVEWTLDAIEVFQKGASNNNKRLTATVDAGYIELTNAQGYTLYRNVDKEATEAIADNADKLVYDYNLGTAGGAVDGTTDPSGIDAEASIKKGAHIIYKDTNNSTNDFHQRSRASLRD